MRFKPSTLAAILVLSINSSALYAIPLAGDDRPLLPLPNTLRNNDASIPPPAATQVVEPGIPHQNETGTLSFSDMGATAGVTLSGQQLQSGVTFTLPADQVITDARLHLRLHTSQTETAGENLQLILNGQPLGAVPLDRTQNNTGSWDLDIPASMVASRNNLSFQLKTSDEIINSEWSCQRPLSSHFSVTLLAESALEYQGLRLNVRKTLSRFPRPFFDVEQMNNADLTVAYSAHPDADVLTASAIIASQFGVLSTTKPVSFKVKYDELPPGNGILIGKPGERIGNQVIADQSGAGLQIIDNPRNPVYKLLVVSGRNEAELRQAAWRLTQPTLPDVDSMQVEALNLAQRAAYDAPRWISTTQPITLRSLQTDNGALVARGVWHGENQLLFRAAPDLFLWDGHTIPLTLNYSFARKNWLNDQKSFLNVSLNNTYLKTLPVSKSGIFEPFMRLLGADNRQQTAVVNIDPRAILGTNRLGFYFGLKPQDNAPCAALADDNIKSQIGGDSTLDFTRTWHFGELPNLAWFANSTFPFTRHADFAQTLVLLSMHPDATEVELLLNIMSRAGNVTGAAASYLHLFTGMPQSETALQQLENHDVLAIGNLHTHPFLDTLLQHGPFTLHDNGLSVNTPSIITRLKSLLGGDWTRDDIDAANTLADLSQWRGLLSYRSPWNPQRVVVVATATDEQQLSLLVNDMNTPAFHHNAAGDLIVVSGAAEVKSWRVGETFSSDDMPSYLKILWYASQHILYLALLVCLIAAVASPLLFNRLQRHARNRLQGKPHHDE